nr:replication protein A 70 kDa DNA-binding subunit B-like [Ipomoea batatas]
MIVTFCNAEKRESKKETEGREECRLPKKPASSFLIFSKEERKKIVEEKPGTNNTTVNALISLKWKLNDLLLSFLLSYNSNCTRLRCIDFVSRLSGGNVASNIPPNDVLVTSFEDIYLKKQLGEYWVAGCIVDVESVADWYYISCNSNSCKRKATESGGMLLCVAGSDDDDGAGSLVDGAADSEKIESLGDKIGGE